MEIVPCSCDIFVSFLVKNGRRVTIHLRECGRVRGCPEHYGRMAHRHDNTDINPQYDPLVKLQVTLQLNYATVQLTRIVGIRVTFTPWGKARPTDAVLQSEWTFDVGTKSTQIAKDGFGAKDKDFQASHYQHDRDHHHDRHGHDIDHHPGHHHDDDDDDHLTNFPVGAEAVWVGSQGVTVAPDQVLQLSLSSLSSLSLSSPASLSTLPSA